MPQIPVFWLSLCGFVNKPFLLFENNKNNNTQWDLMNL